MNKDALFDVGSNYDNNRYTNIIPKFNMSQKTRCKPSEISLYNLEKYNNLVK